MLSSGLVPFLVTVGAFFSHKTLITKCLPIWLLAYRCINLPDTVVPDKTIGWGLAVSSLGDAALFIETMDGMEPHMKEGFFLLGLIAFFIAHVLYAKAFLTHCDRHRKELVLPLLGYYTIMMQTILPEAPKALHIPIMVYGVIISVMGYAGINFCFYPVVEEWRKNAVLALLGALFFIASDSVLAINKFSPSNAAMFGDSAELAVMSTYYAGQLLIALSSIKIDQPEKAKGD
jgi:uncharacterized membrane protein YhhN